jgi:HEAT repeat protein
MKYLFFILITLPLVLFPACDQPAPTIPLPGRTKVINVQSLRPRAMQIVRDGLTDEQGIVRSHAIEVVSESRTQELMPTVSTLLSDPSLAVQFAAIVATGDTGYSSAADSVELLLRSQNQNIKMAAAYTLTKLGEADYGNIIRDLLESKDQTVRANAALLLGKLGNKSDVPLLYKMLQDPYSFDKAKIQAVESIARLGDNKIYRGKLWALLISKQADDRVMGIRGMGALGTTEARNAIITMLDDDVLEVRLCAAEELGKLKDTTGTGEILAYFNENSPNMDETSITNIIATLAIGRIADPSLNNFLPPLLKSKSKSIQLCASQSVLLMTK